MDHTSRSNRRVVVTLLVLTAVVSLAGGASSARAGGSPWHASHYKLMFLYSVPCTTERLAGMTAYFESVGSLLIEPNRSESCVSGPDLEEGGTISVQIKHDGAVVLTGTVTMDEYAGNMRDLGTYNGVKYRTSCENGTVSCDGDTTNTWFVRVETSCR